MHKGNKLANQNGWTQLIHIKTSAQRPVWQFPLDPPHLSGGGWTKITLNALTDDNISIL